MAALHLILPSAMLRCGFLVISPPPRPPPRCAVSAHGPLPSVRVADVRWPRAGRAESAVPTSSAQTGPSVPSQGRAAKKRRPSPASRSRTVALVLNFTAVGFFAQAALVSAATHPHSAASETSRPPELLRVLVLASCSVRSTMAPPTPTGAGEFKDLQGIITHHRSIREKVDQHE